MRQKLYNHYKNYKRYNRYMRFRLEQRLKRHRMLHKLFLRIRGTFRGTKRLALALLLLILLLPLLVLVFRPKAADAAWYGSSWSFRKLLTIQEGRVSGSSDLTNFPVLVNMTDPDLKAAQSDGDDILFTSGNGTTKLDHEIESFDNTTGQLVAWVEIPTLDYNDNTPIYIYYGNASATSQQNGTGVWDSNYKGIWHMNNNPGGSAPQLQDSTSTNSGNNDLTMNGSMTSADLQTGKMGSAINFDGSNDYFNITDATTANTLDFGTGSFTYQAWVNVSSSVSSFDTPLWKGGASPSKPGYDMELGTGNWNVSIHDGTNSDTPSFGTESSFLGSWTHLVVVVDRSANLVRAYANGSQVNSSDITSTGTLSNGTDLQIGLNDGGQPFKGKIDEVRVSGTNRSADWIATEYNNQSDPQTFFAKSDQQTQRSPVLYWAFDEGYGTTTNDSSTYGNGAAINNSTWKQSDFCISNSCLSLDNATNYISAATTGDSELSPGTGGFSVSTWFKHSSTAPASGTDPLFDRYSDAGYRIYMNTSGQICFGIDADSTWTPTDSACSTSSYADSKWHFVEAVKSGTSSITTYIDGIQVGQDSSITGSSLSGTAAGVVVGADAGRSEFWDGFIDEVKVYDYERSAAQIKADFNQGNSVVLGAQDTSFLNDGLAGYWKMDESSWTNNCSTSSVTDSSGNANNGKACPNSTGPTGGAVGKFGNAGNFDGTNDYVEIPDSPTLEPGAEISISLWFKMDQLASTKGEDMVLVSKQYSLGGFYPAYQLSIRSSDNMLEFYWTDSAEGVSVADTNTALSAGIWYHVTFTHSNSGNRFYINGINETYVGYEPSTYPIINSSDNIRIGAYDNTQKRFDGTIDDVRIYNRFLSGREALSLYEFASEPVGHWKLDDASGTNAVDSSSYGSGGILTNSPKWATGKFGGGINTNGANQYISVADPADGHLDFGAASNFTFMGWINSTVIGTSQIFIEKDFGGSTPGWRSRLTTAGKAECGLSDSVAGTDTLTGTNVIADGRWHHVACVVDGTGTTLSIYVDGVFDTSQAITHNASHANSTTFQISKNSPSNYFEGNIDDVRVYNYVRTPKQILSDMNAGHPVVGTPVSGPVGYWSFDEGYGTSANDQSINSNTLTLSTASWTNSGKFGKAWNGVGTNWASKTDDPDFDFAAADDFSLSLWFKSDSASNPGANEYIITKGSSGTGYTIIASSTGGQVFFGIDSSGGGNFENRAGDTGTDYYDGQWHHVVAVKTGTTDIKEYIDGKLLETVIVTENGSLANANDLVVGDQNGTDNANEFNGDIDEVKIYRAALSADDVKAEYNQGKTQVFGALSTASNGTTPDNAASRAYCPPGNTETNCGSGDPSPVGEWKLDEGTGTSAQDTSGNGSTGTFAGDISWNTGKIGSAVKFVDTNTSQISMGNVDTLDVHLTDLTITAWINLSSGSTLDFPTIAQKGATSSSGTPGYWFFWHDSNAGMRFSFSDSTRTNCDAGTGGTKTDIQDGRWHYVVAQADRDGSSSVYVDGILQCTASISSKSASDIDSSDSFTIQDNSNGSASGGTFLVDQVRVFKYLLTPAQIAWDYNRGAPIGWWQLDECSGTTAYDASGNSNNGTITPGAGANTSAGNCNSNTTSEMWSDGSDTTRGTSGKFNGSLGFDGTDDYVTIADTDKLSFGNSTTDRPVSISAWVKMADATGFDIVTKGQQGSTGEYQFTAGDSGDKFFFNAYDESTDGWIGRKYNTALTSYEGQWVHLVGTYDGSAANSGFKLYLNGKRVDDTNDSGGSYTAMENLAGTTRIGTEFTRYGEGQIDDVRIFNYPLTAAQVKSVYNDGAAVRFGPNAGLP